MTSRREPDVHQLPLGVTKPSEHRVRALAGVIAGFAFPDRGSFEALKQGQKRVALEAARLALDWVAGEAE